jgi:UDP-sulfoquinovose synthase
VIATTYPGEVRIEYLDNPRVEAEGHYYNVVHRGLVDLGLTPHCLSETLISSMFSIAARYKDRVDPRALRPLVNWRESANRVRPT